MKISWIPAFIAISLLGAAALTPAKAVDTTLDQMPAKLETQFALSAAPPRLRDKATVYLLDPRTGYQLSRQGTNGVACIVQRTQWELTDFRNDIYYAVCYDALGTGTYLKYIMDAAALRAQGLGPMRSRPKSRSAIGTRPIRRPTSPAFPTW